MDAHVWEQMKGRVKQQWNKLTDEDLKQLEGHVEQLAGKIQQRYGVAKEEAERQAREFRSRNNWN
ncbi:MAG TPA: CsbD family protein [Solirubrobacteraceae bacterium]|nr:CsbD family protein [Solirubrobacteraceae bacterium]